MSTAAEPAGLSWVVRQKQELPEPEPVELPFPGRVAVHARGSSLVGVLSLGWGFFACDSAHDECLP